jgi:uncharacterized membrane protein YecN with MAPEG domain
MTIYLICLGLLGLMYAGLSLRVARMRGAKKVAFGDGGDKELLTAMRAHGNFIEYVPLCLFMIYLCSVFYGFRTVAGLSVLLLVSRMLHAGGLMGFIPQGRVLGAVGTTTVLVIASVWLGLIGLGIRLY